MPGCQKKLCRHKYQVLSLNAVPNLPQTASGQDGGTAQHITRRDMARSACLGFLNQVQVVTRQGFQRKLMIPSLTLIRYLRFLLDEGVPLEKEGPASAVQFSPHLISKYFLISN